MRSLVNNEKMKCCEYGTWSSQNLLRSAGGVETGEQANHKFEWLGD